MTYNPVIMIEYCQIGVKYQCITTNQYFRSLATKNERELDPLVSFYQFISYCILYRVVCVNNVHYHAEVVHSGPISHAYVLCLALGLENHLNAMSLTS